MRELNTIAADIEQKWQNVNYAARPYLNAMHTLKSIDDKYYADSAESVVLYFLSNAKGWRGDNARTIKAELKAIVNFINDRNNP